MGLELLGLTKEDTKNVTGEVGKEFQMLPCGAYDATVEKVVIWKNKFGTKTMQYFVKVDEDDRVYSFRKEITATNKNGEVIKEYVNRFMQFCYATGVKEDDITLQESKEKMKAYGEEYDCFIIPEFKGKKIKAVIRHYDDKNKEDGEAFKITAHLYAVLAPNMTDATGEDKTEKIKELCEKGPIKYEGYVKKDAKVRTPNEDVKKAAAEIDF